MAGVSVWHAKYLMGHWSTTLTHIYNGVPVENFDAGAPRGEYLLFLGRLHPSKGADRFITLCKRLGAQGIIAGDDRLDHGLSQSYIERLMLDASRSGVQLMGSVSEAEKIRLLSRALAVLAPYHSSYRECFGLFAVEALASGAPVFALDKGGISEIVTPSTGVIARDENGLELALRSLLDGVKRFDAMECRAQASRFDLFQMGEAYRRAVSDVSDTSDDSRIT